MTLDERTGSIRTTQDTQQDMQVEVRYGIYILEFQRKIRMDRRWMDGDEFVFLYVGVLDCTPPSVDYRALVGVG